MIKHGKMNLRNFMTMDYAFTGVRLQDGFMTPVRWDMSVDLVAYGKKGSTPEELKQIGDLATYTYKKIYYWLSANLSEIVVFDIANETDTKLANSSLNLVMHCPYGASDDILIQLLHAKISSLANGGLIVGEMRFKGTDSAIRYSFDPCESGYNLPESTEEYLPDINLRDTIPWWFRDDGFCTEIPAGSTESISDPLDEFNRTVASSNDEMLEKEPAQIIQIEKWRPKKV